MQYFSNIIPIWAHGEALNNFVQSPNQSVDDYTSEIKWHLAAINKPATEQLTAYETGYQSFVISHSPMTIDDAERQAQLAEVVATVDLCLVYV